MLRDGVAPVTATPKSAVLRISAEWPRYYWTAGFSRNQRNLALQPNIFRLGSTPRDRLSRVNRVIYSEPLLSSRRVVVLAAACKLEEGDRIDFSEICAQDNGGRVVDSLDSRSLLLFRAQEVDARVIQVCIYNETTCGERWTSIFGSMQCRFEDRFEDEVARSTALTLFTTLADIRYEMFIRLERLRAIEGG